MLDTAGLRGIFGYNDDPQLGAGVKVTRAAALHPDQTSADIFSIDGGRIALVGFLGEVTVAVPANHDYTISYDPDLGGANIDLGALVIVDSDPAGTYYVLNDTLGGALVVSTDVVSNAALEQPLVLAEGDILWTTAGGGTVGTTTRVRWDVWYVPLDDGAIVTAV